MLSYFDIDPLAISLGPLELHWNGRMAGVDLVVDGWLKRCRVHCLGFISAQGGLDAGLVLA